MKKIKYNGHKYSGVALCPMYRDTNFIMAQVEEFGNIFIKTLFMDGILKSKKTRIDYKVTLFNSAYGCLTIRQNRRKLKYLFVKVPILYPTTDMLCAWNVRAQKLFEEDGIYGLYGLKDENLVNYTLEHAEHSISFNEDQLPTVIEKAAYIWERTARFQAFQNGNKRTGLLTGLMFLGMNQFSWLDKKNTNNELYSISKRIAMEKISKEELVEYIKNHVKIDTKFMRVVYEKLIDKKTV